MKTLSRVLIVLSFFMAALAAPAPAQIVKTVVSGTILDPNGVPYAGGTIDATLLPTGTTPTVAGFGQIDGYVQPVRISKSGAFTLPLFCNSAGGGCSVISPSGTQWMFTVRNPGAPPPVGFGGISFTVTVTVTGATQDLTSTLHAAAPQLLVAGAASSTVTGSGTTGFIPLWSGTTQLGNSHCDDGVTTASTVTCSESIATPGNVTLTTGGNVFAGQVEAGVAQGSFLGLLCDASVPCTVEMGLNAANEAIAIAGNSVTINPIAGLTVNNPSAPSLSALGAGTVNAVGLFVSGKPVVQSSSAGTNVTPVTANANTTGFQNLQNIVYSQGTIDTLGKTIRVHAGGTMAVATANTVQAQIAVNFATVQATNLSAFKPATTGTYSWTVDMQCTVTLIGPSGRLLCSGTENFGGVSGAPAQLDNATYPFFATINTNLAVDSGPLLQAQFSTGSTSNTMTSDFMTLEFLN